MRKLSALLAFGLVFSLFVAFPAEGDQPNSVFASRIKTVNRRIERNLKPSAAVVMLDSATGETLYSQNANSPLMSASTMKLVTAAVALDTFGPDRRFVTRAKWDAETSSLYLVGGGDPTLNRRLLQLLAQKVATAIPAASVKLYIDASMYPKSSNASGWLPSYVTSQVSPVSPLAIHGIDTRHPLLVAMHSFEAALKRNGITVEYAGKATAVGTEIARVSGIQLQKIVQKMLVHSDNNLAERLFRLSASTQGVPTWETAASYALSKLQSWGIDTEGLRLSDGSGLSRTDRMTAKALAQLLQVSRSPEHPRLQLLLDKHLLAIAGKTGTLKRRFKTPMTKCALGAVEAKTGTLRDVVGLAGFVPKPDATAIFAILVNGVRSGQTNNVRKDIDWVVTGLVGC